MTNKEMADFLSELKNRHEMPIDEDEYYLLGDIADRLMGLEELIRKIELILIVEGQHDLRFRLGDTIKYNPHEVAEILRKHDDELLT